MRSRLQLGQLSVVAFLPERLLAHVRNVFAAGRDLVVAKSWMDLDRTIRRKPIQVVIVDPAADGSTKVHEVESLLSQYPSVGIVAYVVLNEASFCAVAELCRVGLQNVVLEGFGDGPDKFCRTIERARKNPLRKKMIERLRPRLSLVSDELLNAINQMIESPQEFHSAQDLARCAEISALKLYRSFNVAHLGSPSRLMHAAKLINAVEYLQDPGYSVRDVANKVGYRNSRIFVGHTLETFGLTPSKVRNHVAPVDAVDRLITWAFARPRISLHNSHNRA
jgi:methylphosphotriester-DNA--protein-cysteine methyltransferase